MRADASDSRLAPSQPGSDAPEALLFARAFASIDAVALGIAVGVVSGAGLWVATAVLLYRGGDSVGPHLARLGYYLPGYTVTWWGAFLGFAEAAALGFGIGALFAVLWNSYHRFFIRMALARQTRSELSDF